MKKLLISTSLACSMLTSGCATTGLDPNAITTEVASIQALAVQYCSYEPTVATISAILSTFVPGAAPITTIVNQVAQSICGAVTAKSARRGGRAPMVNGVVVRGQFVR